MTRELKCKRCGKKVGRITIKTRFKIKMILIGFLIALVTQFIVEIPAQVLTYYVLGN